MIGFNIRGMARGFVALNALCLGVAAAHAGVAASDVGQATFSQGLAVPPGVAGMEPKLALSYSDGGINGPLGVGWSLQGVSVITRCPANRATDGAMHGVAFGPEDKLCLDGQRLIQTSATGVPLALSLQTADAQGLAAGAVREFRTEKDGFARIRAYGIANGADVNNGPAYFKVWTKSGQVQEYGTNPNANANALVNAQGKAVAMVWAVSRISDVVGNSIDFKYEQRDIAWGTGPTPGSPVPGHEWNLREIQYSGNKVVFAYGDRPASTPQDAAEAYQMGSKNVSVRRLNSITTYINSPNVTAFGPGAAAVATKTYKLTYDAGPVTKRSRIVSLQECAGGLASAKCLPATIFTYAPGGGEAISASTKFNLLDNRLSSTDGTYGILTGDFDGDGRMDILRWAENGTANQLWLSNGDGSFRQLPPGTGTGQFNLTQPLFKPTGCYSSMVVDANADGLPDIVRVPSSVDSNGNGCGLPLQANYFINDGTGGFVQRALTLANGTPVPMDQVMSKTISRQYCNAPNSQPVDGILTAAKVAGPRVAQLCRYGSGWTAGATYYLLDVNGDGRLDILTTTIRSVQPTDPAEWDGQTYIGCTGCTKVYLADAQGTFSEKTDSNIRDFTIYSTPSRGGDLQSFRKSVDVNGDGLGDLDRVGTPRKRQSWQSLGDGNFVVVAAVGSCDHSLDFNGDGRSDCLAASSDASQNAINTANGTGSYASDANFNLISPGQELSSASSLALGSNYDAAVLDADGDGRQDILRWHDDPAKNELYLSNGDGTFRTSTSTTYKGKALKRSDGKFDFMGADFLGNGTTQYLNVSSDAPTDTAHPNALYVTANPAETDDLITVTSPTGLVSRITRLALPNAGARYTSDRGDADNKAIYPAIDITAPMQVVTTIENDTGIGTGKAKVEYAYRGLKATFSGRGGLGFREVRQQSPGSNGQALTVVTTYLQQHPYIGVSALSQTYLGSLSLSGAQLLSRTTNAYCDKTSSTAPSAIATPGAPPPPCATTAIVQRPYLYQTVEQGWDLADAQLELPRVTTTNTYNDSGDPITIVSKTVGTALGLSQTFTRTTTNSYLPDVTAADSWILGRLDRSTVTNTVPNSLASITTSAGTSPNATARKGAGAAPPLNPASLNVILQLLLDD